MFLPSFPSIFSDIITNNKKEQSFLAISSLITRVVAIWRMPDHVPRILVPALVFTRLEPKISVNNFPTQISICDTCRATYLRQKANAPWGKVRREGFSTPKRVVWLRGYLCAKWAVFCYIVYLNFKWIVFPINRVLCWRIRNAKYDRRARGERNFVTANQIKRIRCK